MTAANPDEALSADERLEGRGRAGVHLWSLLWSLGGLARATAIGALAGFGAGLIAGGVGSRVAMKIVALIAGAEAEGLITENGNLVGAFSSDTVFLVVFGGTFGTLGGLLYMALRPWLPASRRRRGLLFGAVLLATCGAGVIEGDNADFHRFGDPFVNIVLFAALFPLFGVLVAPLADGADRVFPTIPPRRRIRPATIAAYVLLAVGGLLALLMLGPVIAIGVAGQGESSSDFRLALLLFLVLLCVALALRVWPGQRAGRDHAAAAMDRHSRLVVLVALAVPLLIGVAVTLRAMLDAARAV